MKESGLSGAFTRAWLVALLAMSIPAAGGQLAVDSLSSLRTVSPPAVLSLPFRLTNQGRERAQVRLAASLPEGVSLLSAPAALVVPSGTSELVLVTLSFSSAAAPGRQTIVVHADSSVGRAHAEAEVEIRPHVELELTVPAGGHGPPGGEVGYRLRVANRGNVVAALIVELSSVWPVEICDTRLRLPPGDVAELQLVHEVPPQATPGERGRVVVSVRAPPSPDTLAVGTFRTHVVPPPPGEVPQGLYPVLPATVRWRGYLSGDVFRIRGRVDVSGDIGSAGRLSLVGVTEADATGITLRRTRLSYRLGGWVVVGELLDSRFGSRVGVLIRHERHTGQQALSYRQDGAGAAVGVRWEGKCGKGALSVSETGGLSFVGSAEVGNTHVEARLSTEEDALALSTRGGGASVSVGGKWGREKSLWLGVSPEWGACRVEWWPTRTKLRLSLRQRGDVRTRGELSIGDAGHEKLVVLGAQGYVASSRGQPWRWAMGIQARRAGRSPPVGPLWAMLIEGEMSFRSGEGLALGVDGELLLPVLPAGLRGVQWGISLGGELSLGRDVEAKATLELSSSGTEGVGSLVSPAGRLSLTVGPGRVELSLETRVRVPVPLVETRGRVEGAVRSETQGIDVSGLLLGLGGKRALSDDDGLFRFPPLPPGEYRLKLLSTPRGACVHPDAPLPVVVRAGEVNKVELSLVASATLSGRVVPSGEARRLGGRPAGEGGGIARARIVLTDGVHSYYRTTDSRGAFEFGGLCPGEWELRVDLSGLVPPHRLEDGAHTVHLYPGQDKELRVVAEPADRATHPLHPPDR